MVRRDTPISGLAFYTPLASSCPTHYNFCAIPVTEQWVPVTFLALKLGASDFYQLI
jgi:hypothetical protein